MRTFYVDDAAGKDTFSGLTPEQPWQSMEKINEMTFLPGDILAFRRGGKWQGMLTLKGNGTRYEKITVTAYGEGEKPEIDGCGAYAAILLEGVNHILVQGILCRNHAEERAVRQGIAIIGSPEGITEDITIRDCEITDVTGENRRSMPVYTSMYWNGGIYASFPCRTSEKNHLHDIIIESNYIHDVLTSGIRVNQVEDSINDIHHTHIVVRRNRIERTGSDGIIVANGISPLISGNVCGYAGALGNIKDTVVIAGVWVCATENALIERNEVYGTKMFENDGSAFDTDWGTAGNTIFQYNYTHDNEGGFFLDCIALNRNVECGRTILRYNISLNDGRGIGIYNRDFVVEYYGNLFYFDHPMQICVYGTPTYYVFHHNIFDWPGDPTDPDWNKAHFEKNLTGIDSVPGLREALEELKEDPKKAREVMSRYLCPLLSR